MIPLHLFLSSNPQTNCHYLIPTSFTKKYFIYYSIVFIKLKFFVAPLLKQIFIN